jgi:N-acetylglucosamine-6-phosphate deacetylase
MNHLSATRAFLNGALVGATHVSWDENGIIKDVSAIRSQDAAIDALLVPEFIDLQVNGINGINVASADDSQRQRTKRRDVSSSIDGVAAVQLVSS